MTIHTAILRRWICAGCGKEWPCLTRRLQLVAEFQGRRRPLADYMATFFVAAAQDLPHTRTGDHYERFMGWTRTLTSASAYRPPSWTDTDA